MGVVQAWRGRHNRRRTPTLEFQIQVVQRLSGGSEKILVLRYNDKNGALTQGNISTNIFLVQSNTQVKTTNTEYRLNTTFYRDNMKTKKGPNTIFISATVVEANQELSSYLKKVIAAQEKQKEREKSKYLLNLAKMRNRWHHQVGEVHCC